MRKPRSRRIWLWLGVLWTITGAGVAALMAMVGVSSLVDLRWTGRSLGAIIVGLVGVSMAALGIGTLNAEFRCGGSLASRP